ncbi:MAG TPA: hypothetical protein VE621_02885, partial [Bryobacteraceae bacterium]|nr:hypothetical protein [Bryobacteraceae bacterium]
MRRLDMVFHGAEAAISGDLHAIGKIRRAMLQKPGARIPSALVAVVRRAAKHPMHGHLISLNCISTVPSEAGYGTSTERKPRWNFALPCSPNSLTKLSLFRISCSPQIPILWMRAECTSHGRYPSWQ